MSQLNYLIQIGTWQLGGLEIPNGKGSSKSALVYYTILNPVTKGRETSKTFQAFQVKLSWFFNLSKNNRCRLSF